MKCDRLWEYLNFIYKGAQPNISFRFYIDKPTDFVSDKLY